VLSVLFSRCRVQGSGSRVEGLGFMELRASNPNSYELGIEVGATAGRAQFSALSQSRYELRRARNQGS